MKRLIAKSLMLAGGLSLSSQLLALGLGEMTLKSALNQPLNAEVELVDVADLSKWEIKPSLASTEDFERAGVDRLFFLTKIKFKVDGDSLVLTTREPVTEPFLNFLVELNWPSGRVLREYTVLLDPPVFEEETINPLVVAPSAAEVTSVAAVEAKPVATASKSHDWLDKPAQPGTYKVQPNDTLWEIALANRPDTSVSAQQMMLAIQRQNPNAFIGGNINRLKSHQVLRIPNTEQIDNIRFGQAIAEVERQNQALNAGAAQLDATGRRNAPAPAQTSEAGGEVRLLSAESDDAEMAGASGNVDGQGSGRQQALENDLAIALETLDKSRLENQELRQRLESLEEQLNTLQRLITLKDDQLAGIQVQQAQQTDESVDADVTEAQSVDGDAVTALATEGGAVSESDVNQTTVAAEDGDPETTADTALPEGQVSAEEPIPVAEAVSEEVDFNYQEQQPSSADSDQAVDDAKARDERKARIAEMLAKQEAERRAETGVIDSLLQRPELLGGGLAALLLLVLGAVKLIQKRKASQAEEEAFEGADVGFSDAYAGGTELDDIDFEDDDLSGADIDVGHDDVHHDGEDHLGMDDLGEDESDFGAVAQTEDVISESDIYIAYGKFEQAVDLLSGAIEQEPSRSDLRLKLLEVFVEMDDADAFAKQEASLITLGDRDANDQSEQLRSRLSAPIAPSAGAADDVMTLDDTIPSLDDSLGDEFSDGLDFGDALDLSAGDDGQAFDLSDSSGDDASDALSFDLGDSAEVAADLNVEPDAKDDIPSLNEEASLEDVPTLDLDDNDSLAFDLDAEPEQGLSLDANSDELDLNESAADSDTEENLLDFDLGELEAAENFDTAAETEDAIDLSDGNDLEFDLGSLAEESQSEEMEDELSALELGEGDDHSLDIDLDSLASVDDEVAESPVLEIPEETSGDDELLDFAAELTESTGDDATEAELSDLESLMDAEGSVGDSELPDLSFDLEQGTGFAESEDDDLKSLEAELDSVAEQDVDSEALLDLSDDAEVAEPLEDLESELEDLAAVNDESELSDEFDLASDAEENAALDLGSDDLVEAAGESGLLDDSDEEIDFASDLADLDAELEDFEAPLDSDAVASDDSVAAEELTGVTEVPVLEADVAGESEVPVIDDEVLASPADAEQDIDLDKLAAAEDEFDFLAGTDECATKLDLARAYIDMEDMDGARELLQEVLQEGSDQQKQDARGLMDNLS